MSSSGSFSFPSDSFQFPSDSSPQQSSPSSCRTFLLIHWPAATMRTANSFANSNVFSFDFIDVVRTFFALPSAEEFTCPCSTFSALSYWFRRRLQTHRFGPNDLLLFAFVGDTNDKPEAMIETSKRVDGPARKRWAKKKGAAGTAANHCGIKLRIKLYDYTPKGTATPFPLSCTVQCTQT